MAYFTLLYQLYTFCIASNRRFIGQVVAESGSGNYLRMFCEEMK